MSKRRIRLAGSKSDWKTFGICAIIALFFTAAVLAKQYSVLPSGIVESASANGFDKYGYNLTARIFNGTGESWSLAKGLPADYLGAYAKDKLVMKWNAEWDRGNAEKWSKPPYGAWENNEWNGAFPGGSGAVWKYKIVWVGKCGAEYSLLPDGGYCIWGQFETIMDQGKDPSYGPGRFWFTKANPTGYGAYLKF